MYSLKSQELNFASSFLFISSYAFFVFIFMVLLHFNV